MNLSSRRSRYDLIQRDRPTFVNQLLGFHVAQDDAGRRLGHDLARPRTRFREQMLGQPSPCWQPAEHDFARVKYPVWARPVDTHLLAQRLFGLDPREEPTQLTKVGKQS